MALLSNSCIACRRCFKLSTFAGRSNHTNVIAHTSLSARLKTAVFTSEPHNFYSTRNENVMNVFDRKAKRIQRNATARDPNYSVYDYIKEEMGYRTADRICDVKRKFNVAVDLGCGRGHVSKHILSDMVGELYMCDMAEDVLAQAEVSPEVPTHKLVADEEFIPFKSNSLDLVVSSLSLHWVNDMPGSFRQIHTALQNDGCFLGSVYGGDTLYELRVSLQLAETEREGGLGSHVSPFTSPQDLGGVLSRAGFVMTTIDIDEVVIRYPTMFELMKDLKGMGENNCSWNRRPMLHRDTMKAAAAIYKGMYGGTEKGVPATFQVLHFIGWKPDASQIPAAKRGSGQVSLKDLGKLDEITKAIDKMKKENAVDSKGLEASIDHLSEGLEKLKGSHNKDE